MVDIILDTLIDFARLLPFLFLTYLLMELLERKAGGRMVPSQALCSTTLRRRFSSCDPGRSSSLSNQP